MTKWQQSQESIPPTTLSRHNRWSYPKSHLKSLKFASWRTLYSALTPTPHQSSFHQTLRKEDRWCQSPTSFDRDSTPDYSPRPEKSHREEDLKQKVWEIKYHLGEVQNKSRKNDDRPSFNYWPFFSYTVSKELILHWFKMSQIELYDSSSGLFDHLKGYKALTL